MSSRVCTEIATKVGQSVHTEHGAGACAGVVFEPVFERFTERARHAVVLAQDEARALGHAYIGTEHLLLGLLREQEGLAARALEQLGLSVEGVRAHVTEIIGRGEGQPVGQVPFTPRAKKVLELALREALSLGHGYIGTEHVLLGLVREDEGVASRVLLEYDATAEHVRSIVAAELGVDVEALGRTPHRRRLGRMRTVTGIGAAHASWEYRVEQREELDAAWLNDLGDEGWELVAISGDTLVFKRRRFPALRAAG
jgi:hypothetical protein